MLITSHVMDEKTHSEVIKLFDGATREFVCECLRSTMRVNGREIRAWGKESF